MKKTSASGFRHNPFRPGNHPANGSAASRNVALTLRRNENLELVRVIESAFIRALVCFAIAITLPLTVAIIVMSLACILTRPVFLKSSSVYIGIYIFLGIQFVWCVVAAYTYVTGVPPVSLNDMRIVYVTPANSGTALLCGLQHMFVMMALTGVRERQWSEEGRNRAYSLLFAAGILLTSFMSNQSGNIIQGGYGQLSYFDNTWGGWPLLFVALCAAYLINSGSKRFSSLLFLNVIVAYWLYHGNRSEVFSLFILVNIIYFASKYKAKLLSARNIVIGVGVIGVGYALFQAIGTIRSVGLGEIGTIPEGILLTGGSAVLLPTVGSAVYSVIAAIGTTEHNVYLWGASYLGQVTNSIPSFIPTPWDRYRDVAFSLQDTSIMGGVGVIGEAYMNFGVFGPPISALVMTTVTAKAAVSSRRSVLASVFFVTMVLYSPRFFLYGFVYFYKVLFFFGFLWVARGVSGQIGRHRPAATGHRPMNGDNQEKPTSIGAREPYS